jgi:cellulose synthase/poly-beta-1,6-N-acetylglucosamine synthase-like glycosyltransferase
MLSYISYIFIGIYLVSLSYITFYCLFQFILFAKYQRFHANEDVSKRLLAKSTDPNLPFVTIQLPLYNELHVVERLIDNIAAFDYPKDKFEIHVLDDSTDNSIEIAAKKVQEYKDKGFNIEHIRRTDRSGFKAGALKEGMKYAKGDFIAIFDADFLPRKDFLLQTIPYFLADPKIGVVQTRWEHINQDYSLLTKLQSMQLNVHFTVEQKGRQQGGYLLQFNGTAGVWRRQAIDAAGGWESDTLTEDLDLSIRAQLAGYKIEFLEYVGSPAELPAEMNGLRSQQFRWMKGGAESARKLLNMVWKSNQSFMTKIQATSHLMSSGIFLWLLIASIISVPMIWGINIVGFNKHFFGVFLLGLFSVVLIYFVANNNANNIEDTAWGRIKFFLRFPVFLSLSMGLSFHNAIAVWEGYMGKKSPFVRTPKFNITANNDGFTKMQYFNGKLTYSHFMEIFLTLYFLFGLIMGLFYGETTFVVFHAMLAFGYGAISYYSLKHLRG